MKKIKWVRSIYCLSIIFILLFLLLTGCQSTDKSECYIDTSRLQYAEFIYDANINQTNIVWVATLTNGTIFNFDDFSITFNLYNQSNLVKTDTYYYDKGVNHGDEYTGSFNFSVEGKVDSIKYVSWTANYASFWDTYNIWIIVTSILAGVAALIYIIVMIVKDLDFEDTWDAIVEFFSNHAWVAISFLVPLASMIWGIVTSYWVPVLIVLGGIVAFVVLALLAHLIRFIIEKVGGIVFHGGDIGYEDEENEDFDSSTENVADYVEDKDALMLFTVGQLKEYCRDNEIKGYSSLNKPALVDLIVHSNKPNTSRRGQKNRSNIFKKNQ